MSMKLMVRVLEEADVTRPQQLVLVAMAENASDDGSNCFPSVDLIAWKAGYKPRAVVDIIRDLRKAGILEIVNPATAQRPTEYHIHLDHAPVKQTFEEWQAEHGRHAERSKREVQSDVPLRRENAPLQPDEGCNLTSQGVQSRVQGVQSDVPLGRENAPEPVREPANRTGQGTTDARELSLRESFELFKAAYPSSHINPKIAWDQWQRLNPDPEIVEVILLALERWKTSDQWQRGFIKQAHNWLREEWWNSDPPPPPSDASGSSERDRPWLDTPDRNEPFDFLEGMNRKRA